MSYSNKISILQEEKLYRKYAPITLRKPATTKKSRLACAFQCTLGAQKAKSSDHVGGIVYMHTHLYFAVNELFIMGLIMCLFG